MLPKNIYLDNQSTTPLDPRVLDAMLPYMTTHFGNPSSRTHTYGFKAEEAIINAKKQVAKLINCNYDELIVVSGATEANNLALKGLAEFKKYEFENMNKQNEIIKAEQNAKKENNSEMKDSNATSTNMNSMTDNRPHIITAQTEHKAVLDTLRNLSDDYRITYLPVLKSGHIDIDMLKKAITKNTICISLMGINNEIGTIQNTHEIGKICQDNNIVLHVDGAQSVGKIPIDVKQDNIGMLSISGHKIYGPKGVGMLYVRKRPRIRIKAQNYGGGQERNIRSGTLPTHLVVGLGKAAEIAKNEMARDYRNIMDMSKQLYTRLKRKINDIIINGGKQDEKEEKSSWFPGCLNISFPYVEGEGLLMRLKNIALSSGSACTSASLEPSYVLRALGQDEDLAHSSIRFGIGRFTTMKEIKKVAKSTVEAVNKLREMSPLYEMVNEGIDLKTIKWSGE